MHSYDRKDLTETVAEAVSSLFPPEGVSPPHCLVDKQARPHDATDEHNGELAGPALAGKTIEHVAAWLSFLDPAQQQQLELQLPSDGTLMLAAPPQIWRLVILNNRIHNGIFVHGAGTGRMSWHASATQHGAWATTHSCLRRQSPHICASGYCPTTANCLIRPTSKL